MTSVKTIASGISIVALALLAVWLMSVGEQSGASMIIQGEDVNVVARAVRGVGGEITHELGIIDAVAARLTVGQLAALSDRGFVVHEDHGLRTAAKGGKKQTSQTSYATTSADDSTTETAVNPYTEYPAFVEADGLHRKGLTGQGVTLAVLDTGINRQPKRVGAERLVGHYDAILDRERLVDGTDDSDDSGHGTHVLQVASDGIIADGTRLYNGIAPETSRVVVKAFDAEGRSTYADVIRGIGWIVTNKERYDIRVLNLSFSAPVRSHYWDDPVNQAVMKAWAAGIVVVASAGNEGPDSMTVGVPGNNPYVITVGAMTDSYTPQDPSDDRLTSFSAAGPTAERFVKPDLLAPGGHINSRMGINDLIAVEHPEFHDQSRYFMMSGTSQAAAVVTGIVALMQQFDPLAAPDDIKCRLIASAHPALNEEGGLAYTVFQQGAGLVNAHDAVFNTASGCANQGMDIDKDLAGLEHYAGYARIDENGSYYIEGLEGSLWNDSKLWNNTVLWSDSMLWNSTVLWAGSMLWNNSKLWNSSTLSSDSMLWNNTIVSNDSMLWNNSTPSNDTSVASVDSAAPIAINTWVEQE